MTGLRAEQVSAALRYHAAYPAEVDQRIAANQAAADREHALWTSLQTLLGQTT